jgi:DNA-binding MarR family transcriptional regulator
MTLEELAFLQRRMADAGWSADHLALLGAWAVEWRTLKSAERAERRRLREEARALDPEEMNDADISAAEMSALTSPEMPVKDWQGRKDIARAALAVAPGLSKSARRVGAVLVDAFNVKTGRCDPSMGAIADRLLIDEKTVRRAVQALCAAGLLVSALHAGKRHCNAFVPRWDRFAAVVRADGWAPKMNDADISAARAFSSREPDINARQNRIHKQPLFVGESPPAQRELPLVRVFNGDRQEAAVSGAHRRILADIEAEALRSPGFNVSSLTDADWAAARLAESQKHGRGLELIKARLAHGPPRAAVSG